MDLLEIHKVKESATSVKLEATLGEIVNTAPSA